MLIEPLHRENITDHSEQSIFIKVLLFLDVGVFTDIMHKSVTIFDEKNFMEQNYYEKKSIFRFLSCVLDIVRIDISL
jgi:hypothetical protein